jgi:hypothetical protein
MSAAETKADGNEQAADESGFDYRRIASLAALAVTLINNHQIKICFGSETFQLAARWKIIYKMLKFFSYHTTQLMSARVFVEISSSWKLCLDTCKQMRFVTVSSLFSHHLKHFR